MRAIILIVLTFLFVSCSRNLTNVERRISIGQTKESAKIVIESVIKSDPDLEFWEGPDEIVVTDNGAYSLNQLIIVFENGLVIKVFRKDSGTR
jgi:hypothetical protein